MVPAVTFTISDTVKVFEVAYPTASFAKSLFFPVESRTFVCYHDIKGDDTMANICTLEPDIN
ncbi:MAG: hypothetical protein LUG90_11595, partial [Clostridiaceae bacterium]|nr:hypothetical protein [Clostridiaceae bacterium]